MRVGCIRPWRKTEEHKFFYSFGKRCRDNRHFVCSTSDVSRCTRAVGAFFSELVLDLITGPVRLNLILFRENSCNAHTCIGMYKFVVFAMLTTVHYTSRDVFGAKATHATITKRYFFLIFYRQSVYVYCIIVDISCILKKTYY